MKLPSPKDVRGEPLPTGLRPVLWEKVDVLLRDCTKPGDIQRLARCLEISVPVLQARRKFLGVKSATGRAMVTELTDRERKIVAQRAEGKTLREIAESEGVCTTTASNLYQNAADKIRRLCQRCDGLGVSLCEASVPAGEQLTLFGEELETCGGQHADGTPRNPNHYHLCDNCFGRGSIDP